MPSLRSPLSFGIEVLGIVMVLAFRARVDYTPVHLSLPAGIVQEIHSQEI